jgi:hypothetical protein
MKKKNDQTRKNGPSDVPADEPGTKKSPPKGHEEAPGRNPAPTRPAGDEPPRGPREPEGEDPDDGEEG